MKVKKTISLHDWVIRALCKQYPQGNKNFSAVVEGLLISAIKNPKHFWVSKVQYHETMLHTAREKVKYYKLLEQERERRAIEQQIEADSA